MSMKANLLGEEDEEDIADIQLQELPKLVEEPANATEIPEIFTLGGNKERKPASDSVNFRVLHHRKKKIEQCQETVVECAGLSKSYGLKGGGEPVRALTDITLATGFPHQPIKRGEFVVIRGPSGGGKTTFLNLIGTIDVATTGVVSSIGLNQKSKTKRSTAAVPISF